MSGKVRLTVTVDPHLIDAGNRAVAAGVASSLSAWVNAALADRTRRDEHLRVLADAVAEYEVAHGTISSEEIAAVARSDGERALVVREPATRPARGRRRRA